MLCIMHVNLNGAHQKNLFTNPINFKVQFLSPFNWAIQTCSYLSHYAWVDGLYADVLAVQVESVHQGLRGPNELVRLASAWNQPQLPFQIHVYFPHRYSHLLKSLWAGAEEIHFGQMTFGFIDWPAPLLIETLVTVLGSGLRSSGQGRVYAYSFNYRQCEQKRSNICLIKCSCVLFPLYHVGVIRANV